MYDISNASEVTKKLNGVSYVWIKVHYYAVVAPSFLEGEGWVAKNLTSEVSASVPSKAAIVHDTVGCACH